jgi:hypothetical protein
MKSTGTLRPLQQLRHGRLRPRTCPMRGRLKIIRCQPIRAGVPHRILDDGSTT